jgi:hypothetical protein
MSWSDMDLQKDWGTIALKEKLTSAPTVLWTFSHWKGNFLTPYTMVKRETPDIYALAEYG